MTGLETPMKVDMRLRLHHTLLSSFDIVGHFMLDRHLRRDAFFFVPHSRAYSIDGFQGDEV